MRKEKQNQEATASSDTVLGDKMAAARKMAGTAVAVAAEEIQLRMPWVKRAPWERTSSVWVASWARVVLERNPHLQQFEPPPTPHLQQRKHRQQRDLACELRNTATKVEV